MLKGLTKEQNELLQDRYKKALDEAFKYRALAKKDDVLRSHYWDMFFSEWGEATAYYLLGKFEQDPRIKELVGE